MKIEFEESAGEIIYRVFDVHPKYEPILKNTFYQFDGKGWIKKFPQNAKYIEKMKLRYAEKAPLMFDQMGHWCDIPWQTGLRKFCSLVQGARIDWWLTGSVAACVRGIDLEPHDIDIMIRSADVTTVTELFQEYLIEPICDTHGWVTRDFGVAFLDVRIDIASDPSVALDDPEPGDCGPWAREHLETVTWEDFTIKVPPLALQLAANNKRGRLDRAEKIADFLNRTIFR